MDEELRKAIDYAKRVMKDPEKYGFTREQLHLLAVYNVKAGSEVIEDIPEDLRDELADALIAAYKEKVELDECLQDVLDRNTASPTQPEPHDESDS